MVLLNGFTLHYLSGRLRVMDEVQGSNKKHICIHTIKVFHKGEAVFFERGPSQSFPTHGPHKRLSPRRNRNVTPLKVN